MGTAVAAATWATKGLGFGTTRYLFVTREPRNGKRKVEAPLGFMAVSIEWKNQMDNSVESGRLVGMYQALDL